MEKTNAFLKAMQTRYACKLFDASYSIPQEQLDRVLEYARLSPSSFGLEHWHFYCVISKKIIMQLFDACFKQDAVATASCVLVIATRKASFFDPDGGFVKERGRRFPGNVKEFIEDYRGYYEWLKSQDSIDHWSRAQSYIPCANVMTGAAFEGIDSCAIEGFENEKVLNILDLDHNLWQVGIICVLGKAASDESRDKIRLNKEQVISYV